MKRHTQAHKPAGKRGDHAESPFWISYADLMTALMVLFLVALTVALYAVTQRDDDNARQTAVRNREIAAFMQRLRQITDQYPGVTLHGTAIDFGERARFRTDSHRLENEQIRLLRQFVPEVLALAREPLGARWLKRISVVGYADLRGSYLYNLNLSLQRSQRVLCALLVPQGELPMLEEAERRQVRQLFIVSGASFNARRDSAEASRRIELRLEFLEEDEHGPPPPLPEGEQDKLCPLDLGR